MKKKRSKKEETKPIATPLQMRSLFFVLCAAALLVGYTIFDYITPLIMGMIIAGAFYPLLNLLLERTGLSRRVAALLLSLFILLVITLPFIYIITQLARELLDVYKFFQSDEGRELIRNLLFGDHTLAQLLKSGLARFGIDFTPGELEKWIGSGLKSMMLTALDSLNAIVSNLFSFIFSLILMQIFIYTLFLEGPQLKAFILKLFPMKDEYEERLIVTANEMNFATLVFNGIGGVIQGGLAGVGFAFAGFGSLTLWTTTMILLAFIPLVGISIIYIPAVIYLFFQERAFAALALFIYCTMVSVITENWFKPKFMGKRVRMNPFLMFFGIVGGMSAFGIIGIFYGPLIIAIFLTLSEIYFNYIDGKEDV